MCTRVIYLIIALCVNSADGLVFAPLPRHESVTLVVCLTFTLRRFSCISLQRNPPTSKNNWDVSNHQPIGWNRTEQRAVFHSCSVHVWVRAADMSRLGLWRLMWGIKFCAQGWKVSDMWREKRRLCSSRLFREKSAKCSFYLSRWERKVLPIINPALHSSLTNVKMKR